LISNIFEAFLTISRKIAALLNSFKAGDFCNFARDWSTNLRPSGTFKVFPISS
jgi:hypothetical protein